MKGIIVAAAVLSAVATIGVEAVGFAFAAEGAAWSWGAVMAKSALSPEASVVTDLLVTPSTQP